MGDSVKSLAEVKVDNIHCSPLIHPAILPWCPEVLVVKARSFCFLIFWRPC